MFFLTLIFHLTRSDSTSDYAWKIPMSQVMRNSWFIHSLTHTYSRDAGCLAQLLSWQFTHNSLIHVIFTHNSLFHSCDTRDTHSFAKHSKHSRFTHETIHSPTLLRHPLSHALPHSLTHITLHSRNPNSHHVSLTQPKLTSRFTHELNLIHTMSPSHHPPSSLPLLPPHFPLLPPPHTSPTNWNSLKDES